MAKISVHDIRGLCDAGVFRVTVEGSDAFIEETATGKRVCLTAPAAPRPRCAERHSRTERMFGSKDTWNVPPSVNADKDQGPYRGFLLIRCEECGEVKGYCAKRETYSFRCKCGHETPLEKLRPMFVKCKCGKEFRYKTNLTDQRYLNEKQPESFSDEMKAALLKIAHIVLSEEINYNISGIHPRYSTVDLKPAWELDNLIQALYFSIFYMKPGVEIYKRCKNPTCKRDVYFLVNATTTNKEYCCPQCANAAAQRRSRARKLSYQ